MSLISGLLTFPLGYAFRAYRVASYRDLRSELLILDNDERGGLKAGNAESWERIKNCCDHIIPKYLSGNNEGLSELWEEIKKNIDREIFPYPDDRDLQTIKKTCKYVKDYVGRNFTKPNDEERELLKGAGIREDIVFADEVDIGEASALGTNWFRKGSAIVYISKEFFQIDEGAYDFVKHHELAHIKNNDTFTAYCVPAICQLVASIFGMCALSFWPAVGFSFTVGIVSRILFRRWREAKADDFAIEWSSEERLLGGRRFFLSSRKIHAEVKRDTLWKKIAISPSGDYRLDIFHPSLTSRIQKIEKALQDRGIVTFEKEEQKIEKLKNSRAGQNRGEEAVEPDDFFAMVGIVQSLLRELVVF